MPRKQYEVYKTVYLARHGESEGNVADEFQAIDSPLTRKGSMEAILLAERARKIPFELLVVSTLRRARETSMPIAEATGKDPLYHDLFIERRKPEALGGKRLDDPEASAMHKEWITRLHTPGLTHADGGENYDVIIPRAQAALDFLEARPEKSIFVVSHGYFARCMIGLVMFPKIMSGPIIESMQDSMRMKNTGISVIRYGETYTGPRWYLVTYNDHAHLG